MQAIQLIQQPLLELVHQAAAVHRQYHDVVDIQRATLMSIKTGGCPENCKYCPQSAHYAKEVGLEKESIFNVEQVLEKAQLAKQAGASRFCMGAAWRSPPKKGDDFNKVIDMVKGVRAMGMEACCTLGMLDEEQAEQLANAGLTAYNHNLDTGAGYYDKIIDTRQYQDRLNTIKNVSRSGVQVCSGGIIGMGESWEDRAEMLDTLANLSPQPSSVPINVLVPVKGTPLAEQPPVPPFDLVRMVAAARILMPEARVRLSAGRLDLSGEVQALCFLAGANSIFYGEKLLTTGNNDIEADHNLLEDLTKPLNMSALPESAVA